jgi:hypothetical protein
VKGCQIAALSLLGWYLMLPPPTGARHRLPYEPLYKWSILDEFDSEKACEDARQKLIQRMSNTAIGTSRCVSSDDPQMPKPRNPPAVS